MKLINFVFASLYILAAATEAKAQISNGVPPNITVVQIATGATGANALSVSLAAFSKPITPGNSILALCGSGNFNAANWNAAFTDNVGNVYKLLGNIVANSTTQAAMAFQAPITRFGPTVIGTLTLSGSNAAASALACSAYELLGVPSLWQTVGTVTGQGSAGTATPMQFGTIPITYQDEFAFVAVAAASGTCSLTAYPNNFYTLDTTLTPATSNITTFCTASSNAGNSSIRVDPITLSGSVANAEIALTIRDDVSPPVPCSLSTYQGTRSTVNNLANCGQFTERNPRVTKTFTPAASALGTVNSVAGANNRLIVDSICFSAASTTAPALTQLNITIAGSIQGTLWNQVIAISATTGQNVPIYCTPYLGIMSDYNETITAAWSALLTNLFEGISMTTFSVD